MSDFEKNWKFSESYMDVIKSILRDNSANIVNIEIAEPEDDMKRSTDLNIKITSGCVAVRIRRANQKYRDLTIRALNGRAKTEIHKLREGFADWYLYLWTDENGVCDWILVDINKMRAAGLLNTSRAIILNKDGYTGFCTYTILELESAKALVSRKAMK